MKDGAEEFWELRDKAQTEKRYLVHDKMQLILVPWWVGSGQGKSGRDFFIRNFQLGVAPSILEGLAPDLNEAYWFVTREPGWRLGEPWDARIPDLIKRTLWSIECGDGGTEWIDF
jgi:hypothetical protein